MVRRRLKLVIRHIPPIITQAQFDEALEPWRSHITQTYYHQGKERYMDITSHTTNQASHHIEERRKIERKGRSVDVCCY